MVMREREEFVQWQQQVAALRRRQPEKAEQAAIVQLLRSLGAAVYVLGTRRPRGDYPGTRQTPGLPDLLVFLPAGRISSRSELLWIEVKTHQGRLSPAQREFARHCAFAGVYHLIGGVDAVIEWLADRGYLKRT
jgi:hypothetical protein